MTDNEIIKALECCYLYDVMFCDKCPNKDTCGEIDIAESTLDLINRQQTKYERLLKIAKKMHTWIFLNSYDEKKAYKECGLTDEENEMLGYCGEIVLENKETE